MNVRINWHKLASYVRSNSEHGCHGPRNRTGSCSKPGIPWDATEKQIRNDFGEGECGEIEAPETQPEQRGRCAHMWRQKISKRHWIRKKELVMPTKMVFITYKTKAGADKALAYDGDQYGKNTLQALPRLIFPGWIGYHLTHQTSRDMARHWNNLSWPFIFPMWNLERWDWTATKVTTRARAKEKMEVSAFCVLSVRFFTFQKHLVT